MTAVFFICACASIIAVALICIFMFYNGLPPIIEIGLGNFLGGTAWKPMDVPASYGIFPMIVGSLYVTAGAIIIGVPIGLFSATFMAKFCPNWLHKILKPIVNLLAGIPSVVYGFFGIRMLVPFIRNTFGGTGNSILTASILLGIMILPTIISLSEEAIRSVPDSYYEGAVSLGATHERATIKVMLPAAKSGIFASIVLGIGRAIGETMAVIWVAGNQAVVPDGILSGVRTLTSNIVLEMGYAEGLHSEALIATGVVLFVFILILNTCFSILNSRGRKT
ncbi:MAG: phosphate ABC transporter permease subunit PstC [Clostridia bacterium]